MNIHIPNISLKAVFLAHMVLCMWASQGTWLPTSYLFYNSIFLLTVLWTIHLRDSEEGPFMAVCINVISMLMDVVALSMNWPTTEGWVSRSRFGIVCAITNLLLRPISSIILYRLFQDRAGTYGNFVLPSGLDSLFGNRRAPYEDIDQRGGVQPSNNSVSEQPQKDLGSPDSLFAS